MPSVCCSRVRPRKRPGMIWSVSMLGMPSGTATAFQVVKGCMVFASVREQLADVGESARDGGSRRHRRADEVRTHAAALAADEVAVGGGSDALAGFPGLAVHADAHGAAGVPPFDAGILEDAVETFGLRLLLDDAGA